MAIYYYPNSAKTITTAPYSTATNDIVVTNLSALYKLNKTIGLVWSSYTPSSADRGLTLPYIPGTTANQAPVAPSLITSVLAPTQTITQYQASSFTPVSVYGGSAVATSYSSLGTFVGYNVTISPSLPTGLNFSTSFGTQSILNSANATYYLYNTASVIISGTSTTSAAAQTYTITFTDSSGQTANASFVLTIVAGSAPLSVTGLVTTTQAYTQGVSISSLPTVSTQGGTGPLNYAISPTLPTGLTLSTTTGIVSGTPTVSSNLTSYTVTVTDRSTPAQQGTTSFSISVAANPPTSVLSIPTQTIIQGVNFTPFAPVAGSGGTAPLSYKITPSLPAGLVFTTSTGVISGPATAAQAATNYTVTVVDSLNQTSAQTFNLTVNALTPLTAIQTQPSYNLYNATPI
jgi:hypothetical protein